MFNIWEIIEFAIRIEENGEKVYRDASTKVSDPSLVSMLHWLAEEEAQHVKWFSDLKGHVDEASVDSETREFGRSLLLGIVGDQTFSLVEQDLCGIDDVKDLLEIALEFEKDTVVFYEMMAAFVHEEVALAKLNQIIREENRHAEILSEFLHDGKVRVHGLQE